MIRVLVSLALFLAPFVVYGVYRRWAAGRNPRMAAQRGWVLALLVACGAVLTMGAGLTFDKDARVAPGAVYTPPSLGADGAIAPGHFDAP